MACVVHVDLGQLAVIQNGRACCDQLVEKTGKEAVHDLRTAGQQSMDVPTLRYTAPVDGVVW